MNGLMDLHNGLLSSLSRQASGYFAGWICDGARLSSNVTG